MMPSCEVTTLFRIYSILLINQIVEQVVLTVFCTLVHLRQTT